MATIGEVIRYVDDIKPSAFSAAAKVAWVSEAEGLVQTEVLLRAIEDVTVYVWPEDKEAQQAVLDTELLVKPPHDKLYRAYLTAMVDFANGEYNRFNNTMVMFNAHLGEFQAWFSLNYEPADTHGARYEDTRIGTKWVGYYLTAYGIAVKHGYRGSESEWLESLKGERGERGPAPILQYNGQTDMLERYDDESGTWIGFMTGAELRGSGIEDAVAAARAYRDDAGAESDEAARRAAEANGYAVAAEETVLRALGHETDSDADNPLIIDDSIPGWLMTGLQTDFGYEQEGTGDPSPSNVRDIVRTAAVKVTMSGKNYARVTWSDTSSINGITYKNNQDGSITVNGTATSQSVRNLGYSSGTLRLPKDTPLVKSGAAEGIDLRISYRTQDEPDTTRNCEESQDGTYTLTDPEDDTITTTWARLVVQNGTRIDNVKIWPMVQLASIDQDDFDAYFAPIETEEEIPDSAMACKGTIDMRTGVMTVTHKLFTFDGSEDEGWHKRAPDDPDFTGNNTNPNGTIFMCYPPAVPTAYTNISSDFDAVCDSFKKGTAVFTGSGASGANTWWYVKTSPNRMSFIWGTASGGSDLGTTETEGTWLYFLAHNPISVVLPLAEPETVQLTAKQMAAMRNWQQLAVTAEDAEENAVTAGDAQVSYFKKSDMPSQPSAPITWPRVDDTLTQAAMAADAEVTGKEIARVEALAEKGAPFHGERIFRHTSTGGTNGRMARGAQSFTYTGPARNTFIVSGSVDQKSDNTFRRQSITEYAADGTLLRTQYFSAVSGETGYDENDVMGHANGCGFDERTNKLYVTGNGARIVVLTCPEDPEDLTDSFAIESVITVTGAPNNSLTAVDFRDGKLYGAGAGTASGSGIGTVSGRVVGEISLATGAFNALAYAKGGELSVTNQNIDLVSQDMAVCDGYAYLVDNRSNQIVQLSFKTGRMVRSIQVGEGNGAYPYGEVESVTFVGKQMYMLAGVWQAGMSSDLFTSGLSISYMQVFRTNVGGTVTIHDFIGQGQAENVTLHVNGDSAESASLNPSGSTDDPFRSLWEAGLYISYNAMTHTGRNYDLVVHAGDGHDYEKDYLIIKNAFVRIDLGGQTVKNCVVRGGKYHISNGTVSGFLTVNKAAATLENMQVHNADGTAKLHSYYSDVRLGPGCAIDSIGTDEGSGYDLIGVTSPRTVLALGDSICYGGRNGRRGFAGDLGIPYTNAGVSGARLSRTASSDAYWIETQLPESGTWDAIIMSGGVNDYGNNISLGTASDAPATYDSAAYEALDLTTVLGALEHLFATTIHRFPDADRYFLITHKTKKTTSGHQWYWPSTPCAAGKYTQEELHDAIEACCGMYNVQVIDVYRDSPLNTGFAEYVSDTAWTSGNSADLEAAKQWVDSDGVHPLAWGYKHGYLPLIKKALLGASRKG